MSKRVAGANVVLQAAAWLIAGCMIGCAPTRYGARLSEVTLRSTPPGLDAYLIPNKRYLDYTANTGQQAITDKVWLQAYFKGKTSTDTVVKTVKILPYSWVYVVGKGNQFSFPLTFNPQDLSDETITADLPDVTTP